MSSRLKFLSKNIKTHRNKRGLTQNKLATISGVTYDAIIKIEQGVTTNPTIDTVSNIARGLGITIDELLKEPKVRNQLICISCNREYSTNKAIWKCDCGGLLNLDYQASFPIDKIAKRKSTLWRYREALPIENDKNIISLDEPVTPLSKIIIDGRTVFIKQDHIYSTGSYMDRGAAVLVSKTRELGQDKAIEDSFIEDASGSASNSIAAYCAHGGIICDVYVPKTINPEKIVLQQYYGAKVHAMSDVKDLSKFMNKKSQDEYYINHAVNPYFLQGTKTFAFEVCEQLGWRSPDVVILPVGNGTLLLGTYIGFNDLRKAGVISKIPKIIGVQFADCAPLYKAYKKNLSEIPQMIKIKTFVEGLTISKPIRGREVITAVSDTKGDFVIVTNREIKNALKEMLQKGFYIEPTSAATVAGVKKYLREGNKDETIVSVFTGNGYRATEQISNMLRV